MILIKGNLYFIEYNGELKSFIPFETVELKNKACSTFKVLQNNTIEEYSITLNAMLFYNIREANHENKTTSS